VLSHEIAFQTVPEINKVYPLTGIGKLCGLFGRTRQAYYQACWREDKVVNEQELVLEQGLLLPPKIWCIFKIVLYIGRLSEGA
jgi:hypothetical protein